MTPGEDRDIEEEEEAADQEEEDGGGEMVEVEEAGIEARIGDSNAWLSM